MDQTIIVKALQKALANGTGSLDDLEALLNRAQQDIKEAREEEAERKRKEEAARKALAEEYAKLANRLLAQETTAEDVALVLNAYCAKNKIDIGKIDGATVAESFAQHNELQKSFNELQTSLQELFNALKPATEQQPARKDPTGTAEPPRASTAATSTAANKSNCEDDIINKFLRDLGIR